MMQPTSQKNKTKKNNKKTLQNMKKKTWRPQEEWTTMETGDLETQALIS